MHTLDFLDKIFLLFLNTNTDHFFTTNHPPLINSRKTIALSVISHPVHLIVYRWPSQTTAFFHVVLTGQLPPFPCQRSNNLTGRSAYLRLINFPPRLAYIPSGNTLPDLRMTNFRGITDNKRALACLILNSLE